MIDNGKALNPAQQFVMDAKMLETGFSCVLQLATGAGKTWLARRAIQHVLRQGLRAIYITPLRALADELHPLWQAEFTPFNVGIFTGDYGKEGKAFPVSFGDAQVLIMTPERLDACTRAWRSHWHWIPMVELIVIDEAHILGDRHRGARLEGAISRFRRLNPFCRFLCLSATLGNREELADWLSGIEYQSTWRPVPLSWRIVRYRKADEKPNMLAQELTRNRNGGGRSLVFVQSRRRCEVLADFLRTQGINASYHHAGLNHKERRSVEKTFRSSELDALIATGTLEMGLNMPVRQVVLYDTQAFDGVQFVPLPVTTVWQRAGRAGRPGLDTSGEAVLFAVTWDRSAEQYLTGKFERIESGLSQPAPLSEQIIAEVGSGLCRSEVQLERALSYSLAAFQGKPLPIKHTLAQMINADMIRLVKSDETKDVDVVRLRTTPLGRIATRHLLQPATILTIRTLFERVPEFTHFDALFTMALTPDCEPVIPVDFEELSFLALQLTGIPSHVASQFQNAREWFHGASGKRLLSALKTAGMLLFWCKAGDQEITAEEFGVYPFELMRLRETFDRLLMAASAVSKYVFSGGTSDTHENPSIKPEPMRRLELLRHMVTGILPAETATLTLVKGIGPKWARTLRDQGISNVDALSSSRIEDLDDIPGLSRKRAAEWISSAKSVISAGIPSTENSSPLSDCDLTETRKRCHDPYRMRRALELSISPVTDGEYIVSGGLEPHRVRQNGESWDCDCMDFKKGNICKHILAVRHQFEESKHRNKSRPEKPILCSGYIDLFRLWFES